MVVGPGHSWVRRIKVEHPPGADAHEYLGVRVMQSVTNGDRVKACVQDEQRCGVAGADIWVNYETKDLADRGVGGVLRWRDASGIRRCRPRIVGLVQPVDHLQGPTGHDGVPPGVT